MNNGCLWLTVCNIQLVWAFVKTITQKYVPYIVASMLLVIANVILQETDIVTTSAVTHLLSYVVIVTMIVYFI